MFTVYVIYPILQSFWISFHEWDGLTDSMEWVGLRNYEDLIFYDFEFWTAIVNNLWWLIFYLLAPVFGLLMALFLNQTVPGIRIAKSLFFFPFVISQVVVGLVFSWFYDPSFGLLNEVLGFFGVPTISLLSSERWVTFAIIFAGLWPQTAYCMILYLTGLNNINPEQIEAARIDGAKGFKMYWHVIRPQLSPATFLAIVVTVIGALRSFDLVSIMTSGGPFGSSTVLAFKMYEEAIFNFRVGYGASIAVVLFLIMAVYIAYFLTRMLQQERSGG
ncbi:MAG: sugar ABC transporter permease [Pseudomonadota bacterium]